MIEWWNNLSYPVKGSIIRAVRAGAALIIGTLLTLATAGTLFPASLSPVVVMVITVGLQALDKYIREVKIEGEQEKLLLQYPVDVVPDDVIEPQG